MPLTVGGQGNAVTFDGFAAGPWVVATYVLYSPSSNTWHPIPPGPQDGLHPPAVWTGTELISWGGPNPARDAHVATGVAYTPPPAP